jgi:hypothetical protein
MATRKPKQPEQPRPYESQVLRVWIELPRPKGATDHERKDETDRICNLANTMLQRMDPGTEYRFFWSEHKSMYAYGHQHGSYRYLADNGEWLNLEYLGRPLDMTAEQWGELDREKYHAWNKAERERLGHKETD